MTAKNRGFTLVEILVVITIIAALMGMAVLLIGKGSTARDEVLTKTTIQQIEAALVNLNSPSLMGEYPPADPNLIRDLKGQPLSKELGISNDTNSGIESVYIWLFLQGHEVTVDLDFEKVLANTDNDKMSGNPTRSSSNQLYEFVDAWGNPLVYFSPREYKNPKPVGKYVMGEIWGGDQVNVKPHVDAKTGLPKNAGKFQLFSAGEDGLYNTDDDIGNW